jgi:DNA-binding NtrC family response regulator
MRMKRGGESPATRWRHIGQQRWTSRPASAGKLSLLLQIHPIRTSRSEILAVAMHFLLESAIEHGIAPPGLSEDAASFLSSRNWDVTDLASRVARAVATNRGSLITADDLSKP